MKDLSQPIEVLEFTTRVTNCLKKENINYIKDLVQKRPADLMGIPDFGKRCLLEVNDVLAKNGLALNTKLPMERMERFEHNITLLKDANKANGRIKGWYFLRTEPEQFVLGKIMQDNSLWELVSSEGLMPASFLIKENQIIFEAMCILRACGKPMDIISISSYLERNEDFSEAGGLGYVAEIAKRAINVE